MMNLTIKDIAEISEAWNNPGKNPAYHQKMKDELLIKWPSLYYSLKKLER